MAFYSGSRGNLYLSKLGKTAEFENPLAKVSGWTVSQQTAALETTTLGDRDKEFVPGLRSYSGTANLFFYRGSSQAPGLSSLIERNYKDGEPVIYGFRLHITDDTASDKPDAPKGYYLQFEAIVTSLNMTCNTAEVIKV